MMFTLYLIGYGNQVPDEFFERLEILGDHVLVIDIRARRRSWAWAYSGQAIEWVVKKRGHDYIWLPQLGNAGNNGEVRLIDESFGLMALEAQVRKDQTVVLLCAERLGTYCHRTVVAKKLQDRLEADGHHLEIRPL